MNRTKRRLLCGLLVAVGLFFGAGFRIVHACSEYNCVWTGGGDEACYGQGATVEEGAWIARCECNPEGDCVFFPLQ